MGLSHRKKLAAAWRCLSLGFALAVTPAWADTNYIRVQAMTVTNSFQAYAQVQPVAVLPVRVVQPGMLSGLNILPGARVEAGQRLAEIGGPEVEALLVQAEAAVQSAQTNLDGTQKVLAVQRQQATVHLSTRQTVLQTESEVAQAQARLVTAQAQLASVHKLLVVTSPTAGTVLAVNAANGEQLLAGQAILTLQPTDSLWLKAAFYGADAAALKVGMAGEFTSYNSSGKAIPVKVSAVWGVLSPDGGESAGLVATASSPGWLNGEFGTVRLNGLAQSRVAVPTRALILDQGKWWVLLHTAQGNQPQAVVPGPARGWQTFIEHGLEPGAEVVVDNAYLEFHRGIAKHYQPPD